jgi:hypothetical protein
LLDCISFISPARSIQSDLGSEFINKIIEKMLTATGMDRRASSAYQPTSQGLVEKFNCSLADMLRKLAESNTDSWDKFLPFALLAYRTKRHESTKFSPYSLVFGREPNHFEDWTLENPKNEVNELIQRTLQIKKLFEETLPSAKENLKKAKHRQLAVQNKRNTVEFDRLEIGQTIFIKNEGLISKLTSRYVGPFTIDGHASGGNYYLKNALGERMDKSYPRNKLKVTESLQEENESNEEIDYVFDSKIENDKQFFLVKWKDSEDTNWVPLEAFNNLECVNAFQKKKALESERISVHSHENSLTKFKENNLALNKSTSLKRSRGRPRKVSQPPQQQPTKEIKSLKISNLNKKDNEIFKETLFEKRKGLRPRAFSMMNVINILITFFLISVKISLIYSFELKNDFVFCDTKERTLVDINNLCKKEVSHVNRIDIKKENNEILNAEKTLFYIFNRAKHLYSGVAYECKMTKSSATTYQNIIMQNSLENLEEIDLAVSHQVCQAMVRDKLCNGSPMICFEGICKTNLKLEKSYNYLEHKQFEVTNCLIEEKYITADSLNENLFNSFNCKIGDGGCSLGTSQIIWDQNIAKICPLYFVAETNVTNKQNFLISDEDNFIFHIIEELSFENCGNINFYRTNQDLFLTLDKKSLILPKIHNEIFDHNKLRLAEEDMRMYEQFEYNRHLSFEICLTMKNLLNIASLGENKFFKISDSLQKEIILYSYQNKVFIVKCFDLKNTTITLLEIKSENNMCELDLPLEFRFKNKTFKGTLDYNSIIKPLSEKSCYSMCETIHQNFYLKNNNQMIVRHGTEVSIEENFEKQNRKIINFGAADNSKLNFKHKKEILDSIDFTKEFKSFFNHLEKQTYAKTDVLNDPNFFNSKSDVKLIVDNYKQFWIFSKYFLGCLIFVCITIIILFYFWKYNDIKFDCCKFHWGEVECKKCKICKRLRKKHKESKTIEKIEMKELSPYKNSFEEGIEKVTELPKKGSDDSLSKKSFTTSANKVSQTDSLVIGEFKQKLKDMNKDNSKVYPSSLKVKSEDYSSIVTPLSVHKYVNDTSGSSIL